MIYIRKVDCGGILEVEKERNQIKVYYRFARDVGYFAYLFDRYVCVKPTVQRHFNRKPSRT